MEESAEDPKLNWQAVETCERMAREAGFAHHSAWRLKNSPVLRVQAITGTVSLLHIALNSSIVLFCLQRGLLSKRTGLPWEGYFLMLSLGNVSCLLQALCLERKKFALTAFPVAMGFCGDALRRRRLLQGRAVQRLVPSGGARRREARWRGQRRARCGASLLDGPGRDWRSGARGDLPRRDVCFV